MKKRTLTAFILLFLWAPFLDGQNEGAEKTKTPVQAAIIRNKSLPPKYEIGNVIVTYSDGTTDLWTLKGNCAEPMVSTKGAVGWEVYKLNSDGKTLSSYNGLYINDHLNVVDHGRVVANLESAKGFIEGLGLHERRRARCDQITRSAWAGDHRTFSTSQRAARGIGASLRKKFARLGGAIR